MRIKVNVDLTLFIALFYVNYCSMSMVDSYFYGEVISAVDVAKRQPHKLFTNLNSTC